jgi:primosomal protein N' (replication factor Y)
VPPTLSKLAGLERMQMLLECGSRTRLQQFLAQWLLQLQQLKAQHKGLARWAIDVDPLAI